MKKLFRKATAILGNAALIGATVGMAAAASYPESFVGNTAIVVGANAAPSDNIAAASIASNLDENAAGSSTVTVEGGESFKLDKSSNHFNFNEALDSVYSTLDSDDMDFLADGTYDDGSIDEDFEQTIALNANTLTLFTDNDYDNDAPTVGFKWGNTDSILSYEMKYDNAITFADMAETNLPLFGSEYYVLSASGNDTLELLDSAEKAVIAEGETTTIGGKTITIEYINGASVKFNVNGEITDKLADHDSYELDDGTYIVTNEILYTDKETGISKVEFSLGAGLIKLVSTDEIEINDEDVDGLTATFDISGDQLTSITINWASDDETFLTESDAITMPGFEKISLAFGGLDYADDSEMISLDNGETLVLNMGNYDIEAMWYNKTATATVMGAEDYSLVLATAANVTSYPDNATGFTGGLELTEDNRFLATRIENDLSDAETLYYEVSNIDYTSISDFTVELKDMIGDNDLTFDSLEDKDRGDVTVTLEGVSATHAYFTFAASSGSMTYNKAVSEKGMVVTLPIASTITTVAGDNSDSISFTEANDDEDVNAGSVFNVTVKLTSNDKLHVSATDVATEETSDDKFVGYVKSALASIVTAGQSGDEYDFSIEYFGKEVTADVTVVADGDSSVSSDAGVMTVKDSEVATVAGKNLIVVGGSAINAVAAELLGGAYSEATFTSATDVSAGEFLIQSFARSGKTALLVAGYNGADTEKAVTYLLNNDVDTSVDSKVIGTSATEATVVTA